MGQVTTFTFTTAMEIGVYFPWHSEFQTLKDLGITWAVRPVIQQSKTWKPGQPPTMASQDDDHFQTEKMIYHTSDPSITQIYGDDEADDPAHPERLQLPGGQFVNISNGGWGRRDYLLPSRFHRGLLNGGGDPLGGLRCWWSAKQAYKHWGADWTAVIYASPNVNKLKRSLAFYRRLGVSRVFIWRWDYQRDWIIKAI